MTKVFQQRVNQGDGDCAQAALASLFDLCYEEVPDFVSNHVNVNMNSAICKWFRDKGHHPCYMNRLPEEDPGRLISIAKFDGGIDGYFYASVKSQTFKSGSHAVIVDTDLNVVHDPNPNQLALNLRPEDVYDILTVSDFYVDVDGQFVRVE